MPNYFDQFDEKQGGGNYFDRFDEKPKKGESLGVVDRLIQGLRDPIDGGAQLLTNLLPDNVVKAGNAANNWLADKTGMVARLPEGGVDQQVREREAEYQAARGEGGFDAARLAGNVLSPANLAIAYATPARAALMARMGVGAASGAASAALNPATSGDDFANEKLKQLGAGAAGGAAVPAVMGGLSRMVSPKASLNPDIQLLKSEGVTPTIGQALGGRMNTVEEKAMSIPILGDAIANARQKAREEFNQAAIQRTLTPIGEKANGAGQDAIQAAHQALSQTYDKAKSMLGGFAIDQQAQAEIASLRNLVNTGVPKTERAAFNSFLNDKLAGKQGLTAESFKQLDSALGKKAAQFGGASDAYQKQLGTAFQELQRIINDNAMRANPQAADLLKRADQGWANLVRVENASNKAINSNGVFTPGQLNMAVRATDKSARDTASAQGLALMQDLSGAGQSVLGNKVPDSGTAGRGLLAALVGGGGYAINPAIPAGLLGGAAMYTGPLRGLLSGAVTSRPDSAQAIAEALRKSSPAFVPLGAELGLGLLN